MTAPPPAAITPARPMLRLPAIEAARAAHNAAHAKHREHIDICWLCLGGFYCSTEQGLCHVADSAGLLWERLETAVTRRARAVGEGR